MGRAAFFCSDKLDKGLILHFHPNLLKLLSKSRDAVIFQDSLMKFGEFLFIKFSVAAAIFVRQNVIKGLWYRRLDPDRNILLNEILHHREMISMIICVDF